MRLINPGPGELIDRETILQLKINAATDAGKPASHFLAELEAIQKLSRPFRRSGEEWEAWLLSMTNINIRVWQAIDNLRATGTDDFRAAAYWGREALYGNDDRAQLIHEINAACGVESGREKLNT